jgi:hypothetical protein
VDDVILPRYGIKRPLGRLLKLRNDSTIKYALPTTVTSPKSQSIIRFSVSDLLCPQLSFPDTTSSIIYIRWQNSHSHRRHPPQLALKQRREVRILRLGMAQPMHTQLGSAPPVKTCETSGPLGQRRGQHISLDVGV